jgi:uncharacterized protein YcfL
MNRKSLLIALVLLVAASTFVFAASASYNGVTITFTASSTEQTNFMIYNANNYDVWVSFTIYFWDGSSIKANRNYVNSRDTNPTGFYSKPVKSITITSVVRA